MIAIVYPQFYGVGGIARYLDSFLSNLPKDHPRIYLITGDENRVEKSFDRVDIIHIPLKPNRFNLILWGFEVRKLLCTLFEQKKINWVNLHIPPLIPGLFVPKRIPVLLTAHTTYLGMSGKYYPEKHFDSQWSATSLMIKSWMEKYIFSVTDKVITLTEQGRQEVLNYNFKGDISVVPNGADVNLFTPDKAIEKDIDVLFCGRIELRKGSRAMVRLCQNLISQNSDIKITIVGYGDDDEWVTHSLEPYIKNVTLTGKVPFSNMLNYYNRSKVYVSTSYYEGLPGTCLEAMAMELPVIVWDFLFYDGLVVENETGVLVDVNDFDLMTNEVINLISAPLLAAELGAKGRKLLEKKYNWAGLAKDILSEMI